LLGRLRRSGGVRARAPLARRDLTRQAEDHESVERVQDADPGVVLAGEREHDLEDAGDREPELEPDPGPPDTSREGEQQSEQDRVDDEPAEAVWTFQP
jgi:hypothetical protein